MQQGAPSSEGARVPDLARSSAASQEPWSTLTKVPDSNSTTASIVQFCASLVLWRVFCFLAFRPGFRAGFQLLFNSYERLRNRS